MLSRWPSLLIGTATIPLIFSLGRRAGYQLSVTSYQLSVTSYQLPRLNSFNSPISLLAAGLFALSPEGMVWGGRARMYALTTVLVLLTVYWAYQGAVYPALAKYRWLAMVSLLAALFTQFGAMLLVPALVTSMILTGWLSWSKEAGKQEFATSTHPVRNKVKGSHHAYRVWFLRPTILLEGATLAAIISLAVLIKRLGRPIGTASLTDPASNLFAELLNTITYQTTVYFTWPDTIKFLSRQFGVPHHFWLTIATIAGLIITLIYWLTHARSPTSNLQSTNSQPPNSNLLLPKPQASTSYLSFTSFLWLTFGLIILEMVTVLEPFRRNPRYIVMVLPFFYLIAAAAIFHIPLLVHIILGIAQPYREQNLSRSRLTPHVSRFIIAPKTQTILAIALLILFTTVGFNDLRIALLTPEPAYEEAFAHIQAEWQPGDTLLTMNTPAAGLYLGQASGFTVQTGADQFLLNADTAPIDRWLGAPWLGTMADFNAALNSSPRTWFVIDTIRQPVYFRGDWQAVVNTQMDQVWTKGNAIIYRTRPDRSPLTVSPSRPNPIP
jgi:hypothetical protein